MPQTPPDPPTAAALLAAALLVWGVLGLRLMSLIAPVVRALTGDGARCPH